MAATPPDKEFQFRTPDWMERNTPSRRDGMNLAKEESLLWEATLLIKNAADSLPTLQLYVPGICDAKRVTYLTLSR
jgi:hypothetical protein